MAFITSYAQLNKKYNLNFSDNNYGFSWDIFKKFIGDEWAEFFFNYVEKYGWPKIIHQFTLKILFLIKNLLKVTLFSVKIL
ncbi:hypothetical protein [Spiroplasma endosymbiont of Amphimallon solstitiale]|uniref:hypothetical protein n=1 Tax=Spiroplasma endosymbiont of Amphimallon solstitiale TaxID=3066288 RepID=UPI00313B618E